MCRSTASRPARVRHARNPEFLFGLVLAGGGVAVEPAAVARREPRVAWRPLTGRAAGQAHLGGLAGPVGAPGGARCSAQLAAEVLADAEPTAPAPPATSVPAARPWPVLFDTTG